MARETAPTLDPYVLARRSLGVVRLGSFHSDLLPLRRQPEIPTPGHVLFFPRSSTWAIPQGRERYLCDPGVVSFWSRGQVCLREPAANTAVDGDWFGLAPEIAEELVARHDPGALWDSGWLFRRQFAVVGAELFAAQRRLTAALQDGRCDADQGIEAIVALAGQCVRSAAACVGLSPEASWSRRHRDLAQAIRARISASPARREPLTEMARGAGVGLVTLCAAFKQATGSSIHAYRLDLRLKMALERLEDAAADLTAIALDLGFDSHSHFSFHFRKRFGVPPSRMRRDLSRFGLVRLKERDSARARRRLASVA